MFEIKKHWTAILIGAVFILFMIPGYYAYTHPSQEILSLNDNGSTVYLDANSQDVKLKKYGVGVFKITIPENAVFSSPAILKKIQYSAGENFGINIKDCVIKTTIQPGKAHYSKSSLPIFPLEFLNTQLECNGRESSLLATIPSVTTGSLSFKSNNGAFVAQDNLEVFVYLYSSKLQPQVLNPSNTNS